MQVGARTLLEKPYIGVILWKWLPVVVLSFTAKLKENCVLLLRLPNTLLFVAF